MLRSLPLLASLVVALAGADAQAGARPASRPAALDTSQRSPSRHVRALGEHIYEDSTEHCEAPAQGGLALPSSSWLCLAVEVPAPATDVEGGLPDLQAIGAALPRLDPLDAERAASPAPSIERDAARRRAAAPERPRPLDGQ